MKDWSKVALVDVYYADYRKGRLVKRFDSVDDAVRWIGYDATMKLQGHEFHVSRTWDDRGWKSGYLGDEYEFRDELNLKIHADYLKHRAEVVCNRKKVRYQRRGGQFVYRNGPVEGIHCYKAGGWYGHRSIRTRQELRESGFVKYDEDLEGLKIKYRKKGEIPDAWDDLPNSSYGHNNWKRYRKHQYKEVAKATS